MTNSQPRRRRAWAERLVGAADELPVPLCIVDADGKFSCINRSASSLLGEVLGTHYTRVVAPEDRAFAQRLFARTMIGHDRATEHELTLLDRQGRRARAQIRSVALRAGRVTVGVLGAILPETEAGSGDARTVPRSLEPRLTPRQLETLSLLGDGLNTPGIAAQLGVSVDTARNHVQAVLQALESHSRLEAVVTAQRLGLMPSGD